MQHRKTVSAITAILLTLSVPVSGYGLNDGKTVKNAYSFYDTEQMKNFAEAYGWDIDYMNDYLYESNTDVYKDNDTGTQTRLSRGYQYETFYDIIHVYLTQQAKEEGGWDGFDFDVQDSDYWTAYYGSYGGYSPKSFLGGSGDYEDWADDTIRNKNAAFAYTLINKFKEYPVHSNIVSGLTTNGNPWSHVFLNYVLTNGKEISVKGDSVSTNKYTTFDNTDKYILSLIEKYGGESEENIVNITDIVQFGAESVEEDDTSWPTNKNIAVPGDIICWKDPYTNKYTHCAIITHAGETWVEAVDGDTEAGTVAMTTYNADSLIDENSLNSPVDSMGRAVTFSKSGEQLKNGILIKMSTEGSGYYYGDMMSVCYQALQDAINFFFYGEGDGGPTGSFDWRDPNFQCWYMIYETCYEFIQKGTTNVDSNYYQLINKINSMDVSVEGANQMAAYWAGYWEQCANPGARGGDCDKIIAELNERGFDVDTKTDYLAVAILRNIKSESDFKSNIYNPDSNGTMSAGLVQWNSSGSMFVTDSNSTTLPITTGRAGRMQNAARGFGMKINGNGTGAETSLFTDTSMQLNLQ